VSELKKRWAQENDDFLRGARVLTEEQARAELEAERRRKAEETDPPRNA
jgi:hypothetical protein